MSSYVVTRVDASSVYGKELSSVVVKRKVSVSTGKELSSVVVKRKVSVAAGRELTEMDSSVVVSLGREVVWVIRSVDTIVDAGSRIVVVACGKVEVSGGRILVCVMIRVLASCTEVSTIVVVA